MAVPVLATTQLGRFKKRRPCVHMSVPDSTVLLNAARTKRIGSHHALWVEEGVDTDYTENVIFGNVSIGAGGANAGAFWASRDSQALSHRPI